MQPDEMARFTDHTLLKPEATASDVDQLCDEAVEHGFKGVCVNSIFVKRVADRLADSSSRGDRAAPVVVSVSGFPLGAVRTETKIDQARRAMDDGATEIDMVLHVGGLISGERQSVREDIEAVSRVVHSSDPLGVLKVIVEAAALTKEQMILACRLCAEAGADFVKTSTGFHPQGGATVEQVRLLHRHASPIKVKASGGIRSADQAMAMLDAGAARIGTSSGVTILHELSRYDD